MQLIYSKKKSLPHFIDKRVLSTYIKLANDKVQIQVSNSKQKLKKKNYTII